MLIKINVTADVVFEKDKEDIGLAVLMKEADHTQKVYKEIVLGRLFINFKSYI